MRRRIQAGAFVNTAPVQETKLKALAAHRSQQQWLDSSQGMNSYLQVMMDLGRETGRLSRRFPFAEGWRRHLHYGFSATEVDPLATVLGKHYLINRAYERALEKGT